MSDRGQSAPIQEEVVVPVDSGEYQEDVSELVKAYQTEFAAADENLKQIFVTEKTLSKLLSLKVPAEFQNAHLGLAMSFNKTIEGLRGEDRDGSEGLAALELVMEEHPWINE